MDLKKIQEAVLSHTRYIKDISVVMHDGYPFAIVYPDFDALKEAKIINIKEEIRWYAIELYNMKAPQPQKIKGFKIITDKLAKCASNELHEPDDEVYRVLKSYIESLTTKRVSLSCHLELDLELDSLNYVELFVFIEESLGVKMDEALFSGMMIFESLYIYVKEHCLYVKPVMPDWEELLREEIDEKLIYSPLIMSLYKSILNPLFRLYFRLEIRGVENLVSSPCIIAPSHQSMLDGFLIESALPYKILKKTFFLAYKQVFGTKLLEPISKHGQTILIDANENLKETMIYCALPIKSKNNLVIFPEGARTRDRKLLEFRPYFAMLSKTFSVPIIPVVIDGSYEALGAGMLFPRPRKIKVTFLKPIEPRSMDYSEIIIKVREAIRSELETST